MPDLRSILINQLGTLLLANAEATAQVSTQADEIKARDEKIAALETENASLKQTQSDGKAAAEAHLTEQPPPLGGLLNGVNQHA